MVDDAKSRIRSRGGRKIVRSHHRCLRTGHTAADQPRGRICGGTRDVAACYVIRFLAKSLSSL